MEDRTNHNALADQLAARLRAETSELTATRIAEIEAFEKRAAGAAPRKSKRPTPTAVRRPPTSQTIHQEKPSMPTHHLFTPAQITAAYLKMGIMGKQGGGKTKTAGKVTRGLIKHLKKLGLSYASKPVAFYDTETGSDFLVPDFEADGIPLMVAKSRTLKDLVEAIDWAEKEASALIIDSITHPYREMIAAFLRKKNRSFLQIDDWQYLKGDHGWQMFTDRFINSNLHIIMCGRAGDDLDQYTDENGKRQLEKVGVKMKTESETGFEPSLLIEMKLIEQNAMEKAARKRTFVNRAIVVKDRWDVINGDEIDNPDFADFLPHIERLALGGTHVGFRNTGDSTAILKTEKRDWQPVQRKIVLDEIKDILLMHVPGQAAADKQRRVILLKEHFSAGWVEIEETFDLLTLRAGYDSLHQELEGKPSRYAAAMEAEIVPPIADDIPDHSKAPVQAAA
ncbi:MAG TPA: AAA family ATPase [Candidatus Cybelea sp.]|nr:AAA family ATPase [Candidatus Cybelea sp.]